MGWYNWRRLNDYSDNRKIGVRTIIRSIFQVMGFFFVAYPAMLIIGFYHKYSWTLNVSYGENRFIDLCFAYPYWFVIIFVVEFFLCTIIFHFLSICLRVLIPSMVNNIHCWFRRIEYFIFIALLVYIPLKIVSDTNYVKVTHHMLRLPNLPPSLQGFRILHLSDFHADERTQPDFLHEVLQKGKELKPDVVFFTGDLISASRNYTDAAAVELSQIYSRHGIYACLGNHDEWVDEEDIIRSYAKYGIRFADDSTLIIHINDSTSIYLTMATNFYGRQTNLKATLLTKAPDRGIFCFTCARTFDCYD